MEKWVLEQSGTTEDSPTKPADQTTEKDKPAETEPTPKRAAKLSAPKGPIYPNLPHNEKIENFLEQFGNQKLRLLYHELCTTDIASVQLLSVGWLSFMETLCSVIRGGPSNDFAGYLSHDKLAQLGFDNKDHRKNLTRTLRSIADHGNTTKHATTATMLNAAQLFNDVQTIDEVVVRLLEVMLGNRVPTGNWP